MVYWNNDKEEEEEMVKVEEREKKGIKRSKRYIGMKKRK